MGVPKGVLVSPLTLNEDRSRFQTSRMKIDVGTTLTRTMVNTSKEKDCKMEGNEGRKSDRK